jgi:hypothetical protein
MLSEAQQARVWEGMLGSDIRAKYFAELSGRYSRRQQFATWATLLFSSSDAVSFVASLPSQLTWIRFTLAICAAGTSIYLALAQNDKKAFDAAGLRDRWSRLQVSFQAIWENVEAEDAELRLKELDPLRREASNSAVGLLYDRKAMLKWQSHTENKYRDPSTA